MLATPAWLRIPTPTTLIFATSWSARISRVTDLVLRLGERSMRARQVGLTDREGHVGQALGRHVLHDHVDIDVVLRQAAEDRGGDAGPVRYAAHRDLRLVTGIGDPGHDLLFHDLVLIHHERAGFLAAGASAKLDSTRTRTLSFIASSTLRVCNTFAPTEASSSISS